MFEVEGGLFEIGGGEGSIGDSESTAMDVRSLQEEKVVYESFEKIRGNALIPYQVSYE